MMTRVPHRSRVLVAVLAALLLVFAVPAARASGSTSPPVHTLTIQSSEALQLAPKDEKEWYERGLWPLVGAVLALMVTNAVAVGVVYLQSSRSFDALLKQRKIEALAASLNQFYNPLLALLDINREIFTQTGPDSFPEQDPARSAAALVWRETKKKILANNMEIEAILRSRTHLIQGPDALEHYQRLLVHVAMYETFQTVETDLYAAFQFPADIRAHVEQQRGLVLQAYYQASGETI